MRGVQTKEMRESATAAWSSFGANVGRLEAAEAAKQPPRHGPPELPTFATTWKPVRMGSVGERIVGRRIVSEHSPQPSGSNTRSSTAQKGGLGECKPFLVTARFLSPLLTIPSSYIRSRQSGLISAQRHTDGLPLRWKRLSWCTSAFQIS